MKRIIEKANVPYIRFHDFRHTHASFLLSTGVDVVRVSSRLGHSNSKTTLETYAHHIPNTDSEVAELFEKKLMSTG